MNTYIALILTAIVTISTIIYTFYSIQLWRTTRTAASRFSPFVVRTSALSA